MFAAFAPALVDYMHLIDRYPPPGGHAIVKSSTRTPGGAGANVAHNLAKLGVKAILYTTLGRDDDARFFIANTLAEVRFEVTHEFTGRVDVFVDESGERTFFVHPNAASHPHVRVDGDERYLYLDPFPTESSFEVQLRVARDWKERFVILNPGYPYASLGFERLRKMLRFVKMAIMSENEFNMLGVDENTLLKFVEILVITRGDEGGSCYTREGEWHEKAVQVGRVVDTTGAGDSFAAGFIYGLIRGFNPDVCLKLGNFCGAYNVTGLGARKFPSKEELESFLARVLR